MKIQQIEIQESVLLLFIVIAAASAAVLLFFWLFKNVMFKLEAHHIVNLMQGRNTPLYGVFGIGLIGLGVVLLYRSCSSGVPSMGLTMTTQQETTRILECDCLEYIDSVKHTLRCRVSPQQSGYLQLSDSLVLEDITPTDSLHFDLPLNMNSKTATLIRCSSNVPMDACTKCTITLQ